MNDFTFYSPTRFVFKKGAVDCVGEEVAKAGYESALIVYGQGSVVRNGTLDKVRISLEKAGIAFCELGGVRPNPEVTSVRAGIELAKSEKPQLILAVGGGSTLDCAKGIACGAVYDGDVWDFFAKKLKPADVQPLPVASVLTLPAAGSEASDSCVISNDELGMKSGINGDKIRPVLAIMDPELTMTLPPYQTSAGATDMIAHILERFFSGVGSVPVTDRTAAGLIATIMEAAEKLYQDPFNYDARANLMWAGTLAHNGLAGLGRGLVYGMRAGGWESHALEHELSAYDTSITHGAGLAVIMPAWMRFVWHEDPQRFLEFAKYVFDIEPVDDSDEAVEDAVTAAIDELQNFFISIGMPKNLGDFGLEPGMVDEMLPTLEKNKGKVFGGFKKITLDDARQIYLSAF